MGADTARQWCQACAGYGPTGSTPGRSHRPVDVGAPTLASLAGGACRIRAVSTPTVPSDQQAAPPAPTDRSETTTGEALLERIRVMRLNSNWLVGYIAGHSPELFEQVVSELEAAELPEWAFNR